MKKVLILSFLVLSTLVSCKKDEIPEPKPIPQKPQKIYGKWRVFSAIMCFENLETGYKYKKDHFGPGKSRSSVRYPEAFIPIDVIIKDTTIYVINKAKVVPGYSEFLYITNDTTISYTMYTTSNSLRLVENPTTTYNQQLGGSSVPFQCYESIDGDSLKMDITYYWGTTVIDGYNTRYFTNVNLIKVL